jgi:LPXTG-site transpeptidase (sortase) family protein
MTTRQPPSDDATRTLPVVPDLERTQVIPPISATSARPRVNASRDQTAIIRAVPDDATVVIPRVLPDKPQADSDMRQRRPRHKDDTGFLLLGRVRAYDSEPGSIDYRGRHGDLIPLEEASTLRKGLHVAGEVMITIGLVLLLFAGYEVWGKAAIVASHQQDLDAQLQQEWNLPDPTVGPPVDPSASPSPAPTQAGPPPIPPGWSLGRLYVPRIGKYWVVVEGVAPADISYAPEHYPNMALPGEVGNFSVAGHPSPAIFWDLDQMRPGDAVVVETRTTFFVYKVTSSEVVAPTATEVVAPVPGHPGVAPTEAMLTLTTCNPKWDNYQRLIVHAKLQRSQPRSNGRPAELGG